MSDRRAAARYAEALLGAAQERGAVDAMRQELDDLVALVAATPPLQGLLERPDLPAEMKYQALLGAFGGELSDLLLATLDALLRHRRGGELANVESAYGELADQAQGIARAEARSAVPLTEAERARLVAALGRITGRQVVLAAQVDAEVLAGVTVQIGDRLIDGSAAGRLARMRDELLGSRG